MLEITMGGGEWLNHCHQGSLLQLPLDLLSHSRGMNTLGIQILQSGSCLSLCHSMKPSVIPVGEMCRFQMEKMHDYFEFLTHSLRLFTDGINF